MRAVRPDDVAEVIRLIREVLGGFDLEFGVGSPTDGEKRFRAWQRPRMRCAERRCVAGYFDGTKLVLHEASLDHDLGEVLAEVPTTLGIRVPGWAPSPDGARVALTSAGERSSGRFPMPGSTRRSPLPTAATSRSAIGRGTRTCGCSSSATGSSSA